jgi:hypothetical protein
MASSAIVYGSGAAATQSLQTTETIEMVDVVDKNGVVTCQPIKYRRIETVVETVDQTIVALANGTTSGTANVVTGFEVSFSNTDFDRLTITRVEFEAT